MTTSLRWCWSRTATSQKYSCKWHMTYRYEFPDHYRAVRARHCKHKEARNAVQCRVSAARPCYYSMQSISPHTWQSSLLCAVVSILGTSVVRCRNVTGFSSTYISMTARSCLNLVCRTRWPTVRCLCCTSSWWRNKRLHRYPYHHYLFEYVRDKLIRSTSIWGRTLNAEWIRPGPQAEMGLACDACRGVS